ncbi:putative sulfoacetate transporter SauU [Maioricimonas rarisocia]|uniref:Putative sulfoacetate transporter SauU n=1 Tax=Maioricimonas rarisocia TaxID=2528026 RepID=A0A517Z3E3_9PLAN|nr:MFS transporter [Maioricimonas rarisocia]QDU36991.1 putative sulfoacetate transporter SauU [Maioricimonas rarisocia]
MDTAQKATRINLFSVSTPQMRAFHMSWFAFFLCFFAWFGIAPLMKVVREEMSLTREQIGWCIIGSVSITVFARLFIGWLCDRIGPRLAYTGLLLIGSIPVMGIGFAHDFTSFLLFRVAIGFIGASFVITQYHTSVMFAPNCVGTANATSAGWGNLGGGVTQLVMPMVFAGFVTLLGFSESVGWRASMFVAGLLCAATGVAYYFLTQDSPAGNYKDLRAAGKMPESKSVNGTFLEACRDYRVWSLFVIYGACFGIELTINNVAALYFVDYFDHFKSMDTVQAVGTAGLIASLFGLMNIFARTLGGIFGDMFGERWGLSGRVRLLFIVLFCEGLALMLFSRMSILTLAIPSLILFSLFVQMSEGATFSVVPFINKRALGSVSGIVGAGGNAGAVAAGFLFKAEVITWPTALLILGALVTCISFLTFTVRFSEEAEQEAREATEAALADRRRTVELAGAAVT